VAWVALGAVVPLLALAVGAAPGAVFQALPALGRSLALSLGVAAGAVLLALPSAAWLARGNGRWRTLFRAVLTVPLTFSGVVVGFLFIVLLGRAGALPRVLPFTAGWAYGMVGLLLAYLYFEIPRAVLALEGALRTVDLAALDEAAAVLGAGRLERVRRVHWPLLRPALVEVTGLAFSVSLGSYGVALLLAHRFEILPVAIYEQWAGLDHPEVAATFAVVLAATGGLANLVLQGRR